LPCSSKRGKTIVRRRGSQGAPASLLAFSYREIGQTFLFLPPAFELNSMAPGRILRAMAVTALYALHNGFLGFERSGLFYGDRSSDRVRIPITCYLVKTTDGSILFDTGLAPRAVPGVIRNDPLAQFTDADLLVHRLDSIGLEPNDVGLVVMSHLHYDHAGGAALFPRSELIVQKDEYAYAHYPASFYQEFYYRKNFDLPEYRWRLLDGDTELVPGVTVLRSDGHTPGHQSLLVELPSTGPVILAGDSCFWREHIDAERVPGVVWNPTLALHSIKRLKTLARLTGGQIFPSHDPTFWQTVKQAPDAYH
jgi:N-acyl homoserine lactone hydrolase